MKKYFSSILITTLILNILPATTTFANSELITGEYVEGEVIVKIKENYALDNSLRKIEQLNESELTINDDQVYQNLNIALITSETESTQEIIQTLKNNPAVEYAEPNYLRSIAAIPNDTFFGLQYYLNNEGQSLGTDNNDQLIQGTNDADIDWLESTDLTPENNNEIIVAVLDSGILNTHEDLQNQLWDGSLECYNQSNELIEGGCPNHGWDFVNGDAEIGDNDPTDDNLKSNGHGTLVSGIIAADPNNNLGITGMNPNVKIMALKVVNQNGTGTVADEIDAINFATNNSADIINASFGGPGFSQSEKAAIESFPGIFVAAAGNDSDDLESTPSYPAAYDSSNIISVSATDYNDAAASFTNYGLTTVDLAAPGVRIASTGITDTCDGENSSLSDASYCYTNGTSFSAPIVSGAVSLVKNFFPAYTNQQIINLIINSGDQLQALNNKSVSGKRLNIYNALTYESNLTGLIDSTIQTMDGTKLLTVSFTPSDTITGLPVTLQNFEYSIDGGATFNDPTNVDESSSLSENWNDNQYKTSTTSSFTLNLSHEDLTGLDQTVQEDIQVRFKLNNLFETSEFITSANISIDLLIEEESLTITGTPESGTTSRTANITVSSQNLDITNYKYKLNNGEYNVATDISTNISLSGLGTGTQTINIIGVDDYGNAQTTATTATWTIASSGGGGGGGGGSTPTNKNIVPFSEIPLETPELNPEDIIRTISTNFTDTQTHWAKSYIEQLQSLNIVQGRTPTEFAPNDQITRAELTKISLLSFKYTLQNIDSTQFTDVSKQDWFYSYVNNASTYGIATGFSVGTFKPNNQITRAEALKMLITAKKVDISESATTALPFTDVSSTDWYTPYLKYAYNKGIVQGKTATSFAPADTITRGEMAKIVALLLNN